MNNPHVNEAELSEIDERISYIAANYGNSPQTIYFSLPLEQMQRIRTHIATLEAQLADTRAEKEKLTKEIIRRGMQTLATLSNMGIEFSDAISAARAAALEEAAKVAEGEIYHTRYRTWSFWKVGHDGTRGNQANDSSHVKHCDEIAAAIRALKPKGPQ